MGKLFRKIKSKSGETFVEILIAILVVAFGCLLIATMYTSAMNLNLKASKDDDDFYKAMSETEQMFDGEKTGSGNVVMEDQDGKIQEIEIDVYGDEKNSAYKRHQS